MLFEFVRTNHNHQSQTIEEDAMKRSIYLFSFIFFAIIFTGCDRRYGLQILAPSVEATWQINNAKDTKTLAGYSGPGNVGELGELPPQSWSTWSKEFDCRDARDTEVDINLNFTDFRTGKIRTMQGRVSCCRFVKVFVVSDNTFHKMVVLEDSLGIKDSVLSNRICDDAEQFSTEEMLTILRSAPLQQSMAILTQKNISRRINKAATIESFMHRLGASSKPAEYYLEAAVAAGELNSAQRAELYNKLVTLAK